MGVSSIIVWDFPEGCNPTQSLELLQQKVEILGGTSLGPWTIECETLQSTQTLTAGGPQKLIHMLHSSEYPKTTFAVLDSMNCIVAESSLDAIFANLRQFYAPSAKKGQKVEVKGYHYEVRNKYRVKFGSISIGATSKGIIVETEDETSVSVSKSWKELTDFVKGFLNYSNAILPPQQFTSVDRPYTTSDSMIHYACIFTQLRKPGIAMAMPNK